MWELQNVNWSIWALAARPPPLFLPDRKRKSGPSPWIDSMAHYPTFPTDSAVFTDLLTHPRGQLWAPGGNSSKWKAINLCFPWNTAEEIYSEKAHTKERPQLKGRRSAPCLERGQNSRTKQGRFVQQLPTWKLWDSRALGGKLSVDF